MSDPIHFALINGLAFGDAVHIADWAFAKRCEDSLGSWGREGNWGEQSQEHQRGAKQVKGYHDVWRASLVTVDGGGDRSNAQESGNSKEGLGGYQLAAWAQYL
jgi:hypothetical protein